MHLMGSHLREASMGRGHPEDSRRGASRRSSLAYVTEDNDRWASMEIATAGRLLRQRRAAGAARVQDGQWMAYVPDHRYDSLYSAHLAPPLQK